jgi:hypothetical protein
MEHKKFRSYQRDLFTDPKHAVLPSGKLVKVIPARCKSYSCPICGLKKVYDLMDRLKGLDLRGYRFFTLTLKNKYSLDDTEKNINRINDCFNKLNKLMRKKPEFKGLEYFKVVEIGKDGMVHIHGIWNKYVPLVQLSRWWKSVTKDSYRCDLQRVQSKSDIVKYIFKYLTKNVARKNQSYSLSFFNLKINDSAAIFYEAGKRRYSSSSNFFAKSEKVTSDFLPFFYESEEPESIEKVIDYIIKSFKLNQSHFDFSLYDCSDQFIDSLFQNST